MGSSSSKQNQHNTNSNSQNKKAYSEFNSTNYNGYAKTAQNTYEYKDFVKSSQVNNPYESKDFYKQSTDLSKPSTSNPNYNGYAKTVQNTYEYKNFVKSSQVNNPYESKDSYKQSTDLSKPGTSNPNYNGYAKTAQNTYEYKDFVKSSQVNNPYQSKDSYKQSTDLSKPGTSNPSNVSFIRPHSKNPYLRKNVIHLCKKCTILPVHHEQEELCKYCVDQMKYDEFQKKQKYRDRKNTDTIDVQFNLTSNVLLNKREHDLKMQATYTESKNSTYTSAKLFLITLTKDNFATMWFSWKNEFLTYMKSIDQAEKNKEKWGIMLLNRLGPSGQEIYRTFIFDDGEVKEDINVLLEKFDHYCTLQGTTRKSGEDIKIYINKLKAKASKYTTDVDEIMKKKILEEIDKIKFTNIARSLIQNFSFPFIKSLSVQEITYIWMKCENVNFKQKQIIENDLIRNCDNCSYIHEIERCPAYGKQCKKCGNMDHYSLRCPYQYKDNCSFCGDSHFYRECPAYMNECSKCHRLHHFYWKCGPMKILNCNFCGLSHIASKHACPATNIICSNCNKAGHFPEKCRNM